MGIFGIFKNIFKILLIYYRARESTLSFYFYLNFAVLWKLQRISFSISERNNWKKYWYQKENTEYPTLVITERRDTIKLPSCIKRVTLSKNWDFRERI